MKYFTEADLRQETISLSLETLNINMDGRQQSVDTPDENAKTRTAGRPTLADSPTLLGTISESLDFYESLAAWTLDPPSRTPPADDAPGPIVPASSALLKSDNAAADQEVRSAGQRLIARLYLFSDA